MVILRALHKHKISHELNQKIFSDRSDNRILNGGEPGCLFSLSGGVPQGSALRSILLNTAMAIVHEVELRFGQELVISTQTILL